MISFIPPSEFNFIFGSYKNFSGLKVFVELIDIGILFFGKFRFLFKKDCVSEFNSFSFSFSSFSFSFFISFNNFFIVGFNESAFIL